MKREATIIHMKIMCLPCPLCWDCFYIVGGVRVLFFHRSLDRVNILQIQNCVYFRCRCYQQLAQTVHVKFLQILLKTSVCGGFGNYVRSVRCIDCKT